MAKTLLLLAVLGVTACVKPASDAGMCLGQREDIARLRAALEANPDTPDAVGEAATNVVIGHEAGCG